jgi:hypothetical protein
MRAHHARPVAVLVVAALVVVVGAAGLAQARGFRIARFRMPSNNIFCGAVTGSGAPYLRCEIRSGLRPLPPRPRTCKFDWGAGYLLARRGRARVLCISDTIASSSAPVLRYRRTWHRAGFTCRSRITGLRCRNAVGHGFFLSRERSRAF